MDATLRAHLLESCENMPLFPLPGVVFLPYTLLPLHVFEPRFRALVADSLVQHQIFAVPTLCEGWQEDYDGRPPIHRIAGVGKILRSQMLPDGRYNVLLAGLGRVRIDDEPATDLSYRVGRTTLLDEPGNPDDPMLAARAVQLRMLVGQLMSAHTGLAPELTRLVEQAEDPLQLLHILAHVSLRDAAERQLFLETEDALVRADQVLASLAGLLVPDHPLEA